MKECMGICNHHNGVVKYYEIYSPDNNTTYPNRFWGVSAYCESAAESDKKQGFILKEVEEQRTYVL
ncbi:hypothetical protein F4V43_02380 [Paenibacillus spiritus]|uniref:Uncharacterized protein n=1 Tax=Paenibacillus spiritus TaxID=2496557 RepID=A0A5J5GI17_9BACL|nr:hypothetical protein [Paenibacillus spiritus]KAA9007353.1 hypothetical protein F4V43_02380 [Paenibacillus spiritus]